MHIQLGDQNNGLTVRCDACGSARSASNSMRWQYLPHDNVRKRARSGAGSRYYFISHIRLTASRHRLDADFGHLLCYCIGGGRCGDKKLSTRKSRIPSDMQVTNRIACFSKERCDAMRMAASEWPVVTPIGKRDLRTANSSSMAAARVLQES